MLSSYKYSQYILERILLHKFYRMNLNCEFGWVIILSNIKIDFNFRTRIVFGLTSQFCSMLLTNYFYMDGEHSLLYSSKSEKLIFTYKCFQLNIIIVFFSFY